MLFYTKHTNTYAKTWNDAWKLCLKIWEKAIKNEQNDYPTYNQIKHRKGGIPFVWYPPKKIKSNVDIYMYWIETGREHGFGNTVILKSYTS